MRNQKGFTLVELAIVMIIIGLLIGGVLKGQELINNARVSSTISAVDGFKSAYYTFRDTYRGLPGDLRTAGTRISGCDTGSNCTFGNGNSIVGTINGNDSSTCTPGICLGEDVSGEPENALFWKHLALANLITGVNPSAPIATPAIDFAWGETHPSSAFGGGFSIIYANDTGDTTFGHALRLHRSPVGQIANGQTGIHVLNPNQAANIDRKLDDGMSNSGWVQSEYWGSFCDRPGNYDEQLSEKNCWMIFVID